MTLIELVFVIAIVGILSAVLAPNFQRDTLQEAANQVVSHIRYTQHLAMMDNKFDNGDPNWFKGRWQIMFSTANSTISYLIFSDTKNTTYEGNPNGTSIYCEVAKDPLNPGKYLAGTEYSSLFGDNSDILNKKLDLKESYGVNKISITGGGTTTSRKIFFDNLGRPYKGYNIPNVNSQPYTDMFLVTQRVIIKLCLVDNVCTDKNEYIQIAIEPETGYTHIL